MDERYTILFEQVAGHPCGAVVLGSQVADHARGLEYLLRVGAIAPFVLPPASPDDEKVAGMSGGEATEAEIAAGAADNAETRRRARSRKGKSV